MELHKKILRDASTDGRDTSNLIIQFRHCKILFHNSIIKEDLWIRNGRILDPERVYFDEKKQSDVQIDCKGLTIVPGFIDTQINGAFGFDFTCDPKRINENVQIVAKELLAHGVTAICPTLVSSDKEVYDQVIPKVSKKKGSSEGASILGLHLEGPFISVDKNGAHEKACLKTLKNGVSDLHEIYGNDFKNVAIVTLAPELDNNFDVTRYLVSQGVRVSIGHSTACLETGEKCVMNGANFITHLFNAMLPFHHRDPNIVGILSNYELINNLYYGIIADGIHTHSAALNVAYKTHPSGLVLVTDAISAMGLQEGKVHKIGNKEIEIQSNNRAVIAGTQTLCGSIANMPECVRVFKRAVSCTLSEAIKCATEHPAKLLGVYPRKGSLNYDSDADFILIDDDINVYATFINGELVYAQDSLSLNYKLKF